MNARLLLLFLTTLLSGCVPGLVLNLYNATEETLTITNPQLRSSSSIQPHAAADIHITDDVLIHSPRGSWFYAQSSTVPPTPFFQQHGMRWRAFGRIDSRGRIFVLAPPSSEGAAPHEVEQPQGFPLQPHKRPNHAMQPTAGRRTLKISMTPTSSPAATRALASGG